MKFLNFGSNSNQDFKEIQAKRSNNFIVLFVFGVFVLVVIQAFGFGFIGLPGTIKQNGEDTIETATWQISQVEPSTKTPNEYSLTLVSSIGNVRNYPGVRSFGLSNDRKTLALSAGAEVNIVNLGDDSKVSAKLPYTVSGDLGEAISWNSDNQYFALTVFKEQNVKDAHLLVFDSKGELVKDIADKFTYRNVTNLPTLYPAKFAPKGNNIVTRVYQTEDILGDIDPEGKYQPNQLPANLKVFAYTGEFRKEISVRDIDTTGTEIVYLWDNTGMYIRYLVTDGNKPFSYADDLAFTKVAI